MSITKLLTKAAAGAGAAYKLAFTTVMLYELLKHQYTTRKRRE